MSKAAAAARVSKAADAARVSKAADAATDAPDILAAAHAYVARGWAVVPLPRGAKAPTSKGWQTRRLVAADLDRAFAGAGGLGLLCGEPSGGLVDVDLDDEHARAAWPLIGPQTDLRHGRASSPGSHAWYIADAPPSRTERLRDPTGATLIELRSTGAQTVVPPSVHPEGEAIFWHAEGPPARVAVDDLRRGVRECAAVAMVARRWPDGARHDAALALAGLLLRGGVDVEAASRLVELIARVTGDPEVESRVRAVRDTAAALAAGRPATGGPHLAALLADGDAVVARLRTWLDLREPEPAEAGHDAAVVIRADDGHLPDVAPLAWRALVAANDPPQLYAFGDSLARLERDEDARPLVRPLTEQRLRYELARAATWVKQDGRTRNNKRVPPPLDVVRDLLADPAPPLPRLRRIVECPTFARDGAIVEAPGFHSGAGIYYAPTPGLRVPAVPMRPTPSGVRAAVGLLRDELLGDFPFVSDAERAHALALLLLPFVRDLIDGPTPLHLIEKPTPGTGATKLVDTLLGVALGRSVPVMTESRDEDDWRKKITAKLLSAPQAILIDNLRARLDSAALSAAITATMHEDRLLGRSEMLRLPVRCAWVATGNNPVLSNEIARRTVRIRLDAKVDRPWLRDGFRHPDLLGWATTHRGELVAAALTLGRAWIVAGRPNGTARLGMFEQWAETMGGIFDVAGVHGLLTNAAELYDTADAEGAAWRALVERWWAAHADRDVGIAELWQLLAADDAEPIALPLGNGGERSQRTKLGRLVGRQRDRRYGELQIVAGGQRQGAQLWRLVRWPGVNV